MCGTEIAEPAVQRQAGCPTDLLQDVKAVRLTVVELWRELIIPSTCRILGKEEEIIKRYKN